MTLEDIKSMDKDFLNVDEVASYMKCSPQAIRVTARDRPSALGFPVSRVGSRTKIPRVPFIQFMEGKVSSF